MSNLLGSIGKNFGKAADGWSAISNAPLSVDGAGDVHSLANLVAFAAGLAKSEAARGIGFQANAFALTAGIAALIENIKNGDNEAALSTAAGLVGNILGVLAGATPQGRAASLGYTALSFVLDPSANRAINDGIRDLYLAAQQWMPRRDPMVLDLDGDGIETVAPSSSNPILFDHDGDGIKNGTGWVKGDDGFLVMDRNGNGVIDNGTELFGDATPIGGGKKAADGFAALAAQDTNGDGKVNNQDANWNKIKIWQDLNQDGISQANELKTLAQHNIASLNTAKTANSQVLPGGNEIADFYLADKAA